MKKPALVSNVDRLIVRKLYMKIRTKMRKCIDCWFLFRPCWHSDRKRQNIIRRNTITSGSGSAYIPMSTASFMRNVAGFTDVFRTTGCTFSIRIARYVLPTYTFMYTIDRPTDLSLSLPRCSIRSTFVNR